MKTSNVDQLIKYFNENVANNSASKGNKRAITLHLEGLQTFDPNEDYIGMFDMETKHAKHMWDGIQESKKFINGELLKNSPGWDLLFTELPLNHPSKNYWVYIDAVLHHPQEDKLLFLEVKSGRWIRRMEEDHYKQLKQHQKFINLIWPNLNYKLKVVYLYGGKVMEILSLEELLLLLPNPGMLYDLKNRQLRDMRRR